MALTCVTSFVCFHSLSPQAMVSGANNYPPSLRQNKNRFTLFSLHFFAFYFVPAVLQCMYMLALGSAHH